MRLPASMIRKCLPAWFGAFGSVAAMQVTGHDPAQHDRFASGFPVSPVKNTSVDFAGKGYDWSAVGWKTTNPRSGFVFISPRHHLLARHFSGNTSARRLHGNDGVIYSLDHLETIPLELGANLPDGPDLSISRMVQAVPAAAMMPRVPVLDLHPSSTSDSPSSYVNRAVLIYGHGGFSIDFSSPRIAQTTISSVSSSGTTHSFLTPRSVVQLEANDSGSPAFLRWTNPDGNQEIASTGTHASITTTSNSHSFHCSRQVMQAVQTVMNPDGYALRIVGEPAHTWVGVSSTSITNRGAWGLSSPASAPSDRYVTFFGSSAGNSRLVTINAAHNLRGLYFRRTGSDALGFRFAGTATLSVGRGGLCNLDASRQVFEAPLALSSPQFWDGGPGGITVHAIATQGHLLNLRGGAAACQLDGPISGSGGLALEGGLLHIRANSSHTGKTWVHSGTLRVDADLRSSQVLLAGPDGEITGHGLLPVVETQGLIFPAGILRATSLQASAGSRFHFHLRAAMPDPGQPATSPNDLLRLSASPPLAAPLPAGSEVSLLLESPPPGPRSQWRGAFFFDDASAPFSLLSAATWRVLIADPAGSIQLQGQAYRPIERPWTLSLEAQTAAFPDTSLEGRIVQLEIPPAPSTYHAWAEQAFPQETPETDRHPQAAPAGDGIPNLLAYALALDPVGDKTGRLPRLDLAGDSPPLLRYRFRQQADAADLSLVVETSEDLVEWAPLGTPPAVIDPDIDGDGSARLMEVALPLTQDGERLFLRLRASLP
jgi:hypothetical protein